MTEKLYYTDAYIKEFEAECVQTYEKDGKYVAVLDRTAFFPEGGGQAGDIGEINGIKYAIRWKKTDRFCIFRSKRFRQGKFTEK